MEQLWSSKRGCKLCWRQNLKTHALEWLNPLDHLTNINSITGSWALQCSLISWFCTHWTYKKLSQSQVMTVFRHLVDNIVFTTGKTRYLVHFSLQSRQLNTWLALQIKCNSYFIPSLNQPDDVHNEWTLMTIVLARQHWRAFLMFLSSDSQGNNKEAYLLRKNITSAPVARYVLSHASPLQYIPSCTIRKIVRVNMSRLTLQKEGREEEKKDKGGRDCGKKSVS